MIVGTSVVRTDAAAKVRGGATYGVDVRFGGMLGALGHKAIASKSKEITEKFAQALQAELRAAQ